MPVGNLAAMKFSRVIRKVIERDEDGVQVSARINSVVAANVNEPSSTVKSESAQELPDREGTYDELREEATKDQADDKREGQEDG